MKQSVKGLQRQWQEEKSLLQSKFEALNKRNRAELGGLKEGFLRGKEAIGKQMDQTTDAWRYLESETRRMVEIQRVVITEQENTDRLWIVISQLQAEIRQVKDSAECESTRLALEKER